LWRDENNWLRLTVNECGPGDVLFLRCLDNAPTYIGRGTFGSYGESMDAPPGRVHLRMELAGDSVQALCSADGETWYTLGEADFPLGDSEVQAGLHAMSVVYPGTAYIPSPDGTAIRFESFTTWGIE
jgi:hypothetical protein